ncbi:MAG: hypothetical protein Q4E72_11925 [bacterium]|nr:hypothetical protein [bacterium]
MNQGPTYFNQPPSGVPQPPNSPYQPGFTGFQAQPQPPAGNGAGSYQQPYQTAYRQPVPGQARPQQPYQTAYGRAHL